jgi:hypothetical protein
MKHAIRHIHFVERENAQPRPWLCGTVPANADKGRGGLTA